MEKITIILLMIMCVFLCQNCQHDESTTKVKGYISFSVDSIKGYDAISISLDQFIFSPLENQNKIWLLNTNNIQELDLLTNIRTPLSQRYGHEFNSRVNKNSIWKDSVGNSAYISLVNDFLMKIDIDKDTFYKIMVHPITAFLPIEDKIILGNGKEGIFFLDRDSREISVVNNFSYTQWIGSLSSYNGDTILINDNLLYDLKSKSAHEIKTKKVADLHVGIKNLRKKLRFNLRNGEGLLDNKHIWYSVANHLFWTNNKDSIFLFNKLPSGHLRNIIADSIYLYALYDDMFYIFNKEFIYSNSTYYNDGKRKKNVAYFFKAENSLANFNGSIFVYIKNAEKLLNNPRYNNLNELKNGKNSLVRGIARLQHIPNSRKETEQAILDGTLPEKYLYHALRGLCDYYTSVYELNKANHYFGMIQKNNPEKKDECLTILGKCVNDILVKTDSLERSLESEDKLFYENIILKDKFVRCGCWFTRELMYDLVYKDLNYFLTEYPWSPLVDNCAYWKIQIDLFRDSEGSYSVEVINTLKEFIHRYPDSELMLKAKIRLANVFSRIDGNNDTILHFLDKGISLLKDVKQTYKLDKSQLREIDSSLRDIYNKKNSYTFKFDIKSRFNSYNREDDIIFDISIENLTSKRQKIKSYTNSPFITNLKLSESVEFIPFTTDTIIQDYFIAPNDILKRTIILNKKSRIFGKTNHVGKYNFLKSGYHKLDISWVDKKIFSREIKFYVK